MFHKKTDRQRIKWSLVFTIVGLVTLICCIRDLIQISNQTLEITSQNYENILQAKMALFKLKFSIGLLTIGGWVIYLLMTIIGNSPLGKYMWIYSSLDSEETKSNKTLSMGIVFAGLSIGIFQLLSTIVGK